MIIARKYPSALMLPAAAVALASLSACGMVPGDEQARSQARCERTFARMAPDPSQGQALCSCMTERLADEGMTIIDTMGSGSGKGQEIVRQCASENGVQLPG